MTVNSGVTQPASNNEMSKGDARQDAALTYLRRCQRRGQSCAVVTGCDETALALLALHFRREYGSPLIRMAPAGLDAHAALTSILKAFGFEGFDTTLRELIKLALVFFREQSAKGLTPAIIVERAHEADPFLLEVLESLAHPESERSPLMFLLLTGDETLNGLIARPSDGTALRYGFW